MIRSKVLPLFALFVLALFFSACNSDESSPAVLTQIQLTSEVSELPEGLQTQLNAIGYYSDGRTKDLRSVASWTSRSPDVATVYQGWVNAISTGDVVISVEYEGLSESVSLTVSDAILQSIIVDPVTTSVPLGIEVQYRAIGTFSDQSTHDISLQSGLSWNSTQVSVATVDQTTAKANTLSIGGTHISATMQGVTSNVTDLTVTDAIQTAIWVTPEEATMPLGITKQFTAVASYSDGSELDITDGFVNWSSSNFNNLVSQGAGLFHAVREGLAFVSVTDPVSQMQSVNSPRVEVVQKAMDHMIVRAGEKGEDQDSIPLGEALQFSASAIFTDGSEYDISGFRQVFWQSSDTTIATVSLSGHVQTLKEGVVTITATADHFSENADKTISVDVP